MIEPAMGADRSVLAFLCDAYCEEETDKETRTLLKLHPEIAPIKIAVLPLSRNEKLSEYSKNIFDRLNSLYTTQYDDTQSIGRRYRRQDEVGTPLCVTIDFESVEEDDSVTIRNRDTMEQIRVSSDKLLEAINLGFGNFTKPSNFFNLGTNNKNTIQKKWVRNDKNDNIKV